MRGSCLTQNGVWFKSQEERERNMDRAGERRENGGQNSIAHRGLIYPLSLLQFFLPLLLVSLLFSLSRNCCPFFLHLISPPPPTPHPAPSFPPCLVASGQQHATISSHHHRYRLMAARTSRTLGGNL